MEGAGGDEQDVVGFDRSVLGRHRGPFDQWQKVALHALAADVAAEVALAGGDFVDLVEKDDAVVLNGGDRLVRHLFVVQQFVGFLVDQDLVGIADIEAPRLGAPAEGLAEHVADVHDADAAAGNAGYVKRRHAAAGVADLDFDLLVVELTIAQPLAERLFGGRAGGRPDQGGEHAFLRRQFGLGRDLLAAAVTDQADADLQEIADDRFHVAPDIAHFGELGRLDLHERGAGEPGQAARYLRLADTGGANHENVLGQNLFAHRAGQLLATPAVAERDRHRSLGIALADDEAIQLGDDFTGRKGRHARLFPSSICRVSTVTWVLV